MSQFTNNFGSGKGITKGLWRLDGNSRDFSGNGNNGTDSNVTYPVVNGRRVASFNGTNSYISTGLDLKNTTKTIIAWVKPAATATRVIVNQWYAPASWEFVLDANNHLAYSSYNGSTIDSVTSTMVLSIGIWYMVGVSYNPVNNVASLYIDGVLVASKALSVEESTSASNGMWFGRENGSTVYSPFNGSIRDARVDSRLWSGTEFASYYASTKNKFGETLYAPVWKPFSKIGQVISATSNFFFAFFNQ